MDFVNIALLSIPPLGGYNYITPRRAGLSATAGFSCFDKLSSDSEQMRTETWVKGPKCYGEIQTVPR